MRTAQHPKLRPLCDTIRRRSRTGWRLSIAIATLSVIALVASASGQLGPAPDVYSDNALHVFVCGSASPLGPDPTRAQACIAVTAGERLFLVDTGSGSAAKLGLARIPMEHLKGVLLTHFHSDHIGDLADMNLNSWIAGRKTPLEVMGPEGVETVVGGLNTAYSLDRGYRIAHHGEELLPPSAGPMSAKTVKPGVIYEQDGLKITAFTVDHQPVHPAFGYRFDFKGRSVVISGDSVRSENLEAVAKGADILFHDTMIQGVLQQMRGMVQSSNPRLAKLVDDVQTYHAPAPDVVASAAAAGVRLVVFYHLVPNPMNPMIANAYQRALPDNGVLAEDGMLFTLTEGAPNIQRTNLLNN